MKNTKSTMLDDLANLFCEAIEVVAEYHGFTLHRAAETRGSFTTFKRGFYRIVINDRAWAVVNEIGEKPKYLADGHAPIELDAWLEANLVELMPKY